MKPLKQKLKETKKPVSVSMTDSEKAELTKKAKRHGRSLSNFLIWSALQA